MSREQWRASFIMFVVGFIIVLLVLSLTVQRSAQYAPSSVALFNPPTPVAGAVSAGYTAANVGPAPNANTTIPAADAPGYNDDPAIPRYPGAVLLDHRTTLLVSQLHYISKDRPFQIANFYANYAYDRLGMTTDTFGELGSGVYGYHLAYSSADHTSSLIMFATSQNADGPSGGVDNPTYINLMIIGQIKPLGQPTPTMPPAWLTPQTWNLSPYTPTPVPHR